MLDPFEYAKMSGVRVKYIDIMPEGFLGLYMAEPPDIPPTACLAPVLRRYPRAERCVLTHEVNHHFFPVGDSLFSSFYVDKLLHNKAEKEVLKRSAELLVPRKECLKFLKRNRNLSDEALVERIEEKFDVLSSIAYISLGLITKRLDWDIVIHLVKQECNGIR